MDVVQNLKKMKKLNRKGKLLNKVDDDEDAEKNAVVSSLMVKCDKTKEEVVEAYEEFHLKYQDGSIANEEYIKSTSTKVQIICTRFSLAQSSSSCFRTYWQLWPL